MKIPQVRVELYKFIDDNKWSSTPIVLDFPLEIDEDEGIEIRKDTFHFRIQNSRLSKTGSYDNRLGASNPDANAFRMKDKALIYAWYGTQPNNITPHLLIDGIINEINYSPDESSSLISISGANATEELLSNMVPTSVQKGVEQLDAPRLIIEIMKRVNSFNKGKKVAAWLDSEKRIWNPATQQFDIDNVNGLNGSIQSKKSDGITSFPHITYAENWKSAYIQIETLSTAEYTEDDNSGTYIFGIKPWVDPINGNRFNQLFWVNKNVSITGSYEEGVEVYPIKIRRGTWDVYNAVIINAGEDLFGAGILRVAYNPTSMGKIGAKWKYLPMTNKFERLYDAQVSKGVGAGSSFGDDRFPNAFDEVGSVWDMGFDTRDGSGNPSGTEATSETDKQFNDNIRTEAGWQAQNEGQEIVEQFGEARYKADVDLEIGSNNYVLGDLNEIISPSYDWEGTNTKHGKKLRLLDARHSLNNSGWSTTLFFEEDEKVLSDLVN